MKTIVTTSNAYKHLIPIFCHLWAKAGGGKIELVGYEQPDNLPDWGTFVSLGIQGSKKDFTNELRPYFNQQPDNFMWLCEDSFVKEIDHASLQMAFGVMKKTFKMGKFCLTTESMRREHIVSNGMFYVNPEAKYRLSTQPAIWKREFLLQYFNRDLSIWDFETQESILDGWNICGFTENVIEHNEGTTKKDIYKLDLNGFDEQTLKEINELQYRSWPNSN